MRNKSKTKKVSFEVYQHLKTGLYIAKRVGEQWTTWNIWKDIDLMQEHSIGFHTKADAIYFLDNLNN